MSQISRKRKKKHDKTILLGKSKLDAVEVLTSKSLIDSYISHDEFVSVNNMLRKYNEMEEGIKQSWNFCGIHYINMVNISSVLICKVKEKEKTCSFETALVEKTESSRNKNGLVEGL